MQQPFMRPGDVVTAANESISALQAHGHRDWSVQAGDLEWSCTRTLDHMVDTLVLYSAYVATRATERRSPVRNGDASASVPELISALDASARMLDLVCDASPPPARAFHPSGDSDADGFRAMASSEILTHTHDILLGFDAGNEFRPPQELCERILKRVFPWAPDPAQVPDRWQAVQWACGRIALPEHPRLNERWWWHAVPLAEWDGTRNERTAPPAWT